ncbi:MAG TPA: potassium transporter TrkG, partial [Bacteroidales bacterium]|nr:potassium transporter TrkG [Bacteroidales bacterium]
MRSGTIGIVLKQIGSLLNVLGIIFILPFIVSAMYDEWFSAAGFLLSAGVVLGIGLALYKIFNKAEDPQYNHGLIIAASSWLIITLMGAIPFIIIAKLTPDTEMSKFIPAGALYKESSLVYFNNFLHCFFESMSAYTTTGLSMAIHEPSVGKGVLFYRSLAQWVGGAGFIVMALAVFKQTSGQGAMLLYGAESTSEKLMPKVIDTSRAIWRVYFLLTAFTIAYLVVGTKLILPTYRLADNIFDSVNHAMSGLSTGGFSTLDDMMSTYQSPYMEMLYLLPMILGSFSIPFYYKLIFKRKISEIWKDIQTRSLIIAFVAGSIIQSFLLFKANAVPEPVREGVFQFVSALSTTGWQTSNIHH